jgi:hypothetical protein
MGFATDHDLIGRTKVTYGGDNVAVTAGGTNDATQQTGVTLDRFALNLPLVGLLCLRYKAVLAAAATLSLAYVIEHSDDGTNFVAYQSANASVIATGPAGGGTVRDVFKVNVDLAGAKQYVRAKYTPDMSAANTDTAELSAEWILDGQRSKPNA